MRPERPDDLIIQQPDGPAQQLVLLFHGVGSSAQNMLPVGEHLAAAYPNAAVISVQAPFASDFGQGWQWFSVACVTEDNRPARVLEAMPLFVKAVQGWQQHTGVTPHATVLVGFSQGAIMALESTQREAEGEHDALLAGRVVALSGRFAQDPRHAPAATVLHFIHGKHDPVMPYAHTVRAAEMLIQQGADVTADVIPFLEHAVTPEVLELVVERLQGYVPQRHWRAALQGAEDLPG